MLKFWGNQEEECVAITVRIYWCFTKNVVKLWTAYKGLYLGPSRSAWQSFLFRDSPPLGGSGVFPPPLLIFSKYQHLESERWTQQRAGILVWILFRKVFNDSFKTSPTMYRQEGMCWRCTVHNLFEWCIIKQGVCSWLRNTMYHCNVATGNM